MSDDELEINQKHLKVLDIAILCHCKIAQRANNKYADDPSYIPERIGINCL